MATRSGQTSWTSVWLSRDMISHGPMWIKTCDAILTEKTMWTQHPATVAYRYAYFAPRY